MVSTEVLDRIRKVERSRAYMCTVYEKLCVALPGISREEQLSLTFRALNDALHTNSGIYPAALAFRIYSKLYRARDQGTVIQRTAIIREFTAIVACMKAQRTVRDSVEVCNFPSHSQVENVKKMRSGHQALIYREVSRWRKNELTDVSGDEVKVLQPSRNIPSFPINVACASHKKTNSSESNDDDASKPFHTERNTKIKTAQHYMLTQSRIKNENFGTGFHFMISENDEDINSPSQAEEIDALKQLEFFTIVEAKEAVVHQIYR